MALALLFGAQENGDAMPTVSTFVGQTGVALSFAAKTEAGAAQSLAAYSAAYLSARCGDSWMFDMAPMTIAAGDGGGLSITPTAAQIATEGKYEATIRLVTSGGAVAFLEPFVIDVRAANENAPELTWTKITTWFMYHPSADMPNVGGNIYPGTPYNDDAIWLMYKAEFNLDIARCTIGWRSRYADGSEEGWSATGAIGRPEYASGCIIYGAGATSPQPKVAYTTDWHRWGGNADTRLRFVLRDLVTLDGRVHEDIDTGILWNPGVYEPAALVGRKFEFTPTDLDGTEIDITLSGGEPETDPPQMEET